jgi:hypothetical protein
MCARRTLIRKTKNIKKNGGMLLVVFTVKINCLPLPKVLVTASSLNYFAPADEKKDSIQPVLIYFCIKRLKPFELLFLF